MTRLLTDSHGDEHLVDSLLLAIKEDGAPEADKKVRILLQQKNLSYIFTQINQFT